MTNQKYTLKNLYLSIKHWFDFEPPNALSMEGWNSFDKEFKEKAPVRYFIKRGPIRSAYSKMIYALENAIYWIKYRTVDKHHIVHTGLTPGWRGPDELLLHCSFNILNTYIVSSTHLELRTVLTKIKDLFLFRNRKVIQIEEAVKYYSDNNNINYTVSGAKELFLWWNTIRPERKEIELPYINDSDWHSYCKNRHVTPCVQLYLDAIDLQEKQREEWDKEDTEQLIKLVNLRHHLY